MKTKAELIDMYMALLKQAGMDLPPKKRMTTGRWSDGHGAHCPFGHVVKGTDEFAILRTLRKQYGLNEDDVMAFAKQDLAEIKESLQNVNMNLNKLR